MHPWPPVAELNFLVGYQLTAVRISSWPVDLYFSKPPDVVIKLESPVRIRFPDGRIVEPAHLPDAGVALIGLIGGTISGVKRLSPHCVTIELDVGEITLESSDSQYESFSILGDGRAIYV